MNHKNWAGFTAGQWQDEINVRDFIQKNYKPYEGDDTFLAGAESACNLLHEQVIVHSLLGYAVVHSPKVLLDNLAASSSGRQ